MFMSFDFVSYFLDAQTVLYLNLLSFLLAFLFVLLYALRYFRHRNGAVNSKTCSVLIVLGSGGHTTEMLRLVGSLSRRYSNRIYVLADSDVTSEKKAQDFERNTWKKGGDFEMWRVPRAREVRQAYLSSVLTSLNSLVHCLPLGLSLRPDLVLCNGPGTCVPIVFVFAMLDTFFIQQNTVVFVESVCRVRSLSLSGELLYFSGLANYLVVQWPYLKELYPNSVYLDGRVV